MTIDEFYKECEIRGYAVSKIDDMVTNPVNGQGFPRVKELCGDMAAFQGEASASAFLEAALSILHSGIDK